jgi:tRNA pseudouridine55 synthase
VLVVDKPAGVTSHDVVAVARRHLGEKRIGHTGTLDPLATGVLPLALGRATRLVQFLSSSDKDYEATVGFGVTTDTYDAAGAETGRSGRVPTREQVEQALATLTGEYLQTPPAFSAKKVAGQRAYVLARAQQPVELTPVSVRVSRAGLAAFADGVAVVSVTCSAGFYVRAFAHELGVLTGAGAHLAALRRTRSGDFDLTRSVTLDMLRAGPAACAARVVRPGELLPAVPAVRVGADGRDRAAHGRVLDASHVAPLTGDIGDGWVRLIGEDGDLLAMALATDGVLHPRVVLI